MVALALGAAAARTVARAEAPEEQPRETYDLRLGLEPGPATTWQVLREVRADGAIEPDVLALVYEERVLAPEPAPAPDVAPRARIETKVLRARWSEPLPGGGRRELDSAVPVPAGQAPGGPPDELAGLWAILAGTAGSTLTVSVDARGQVDQLEGLGDLRARIRAQLPVERAELLWKSLSARLGDASMRAQLSDHLSWLPGEPVAVGAHWARQSSQSLLGGMLQVDGELAYTLESARQVEGRTQLAIKIQGELAGTSQVAGLTYDGGTCDGQLLFDATHGRLEELHLSTTVQVHQDGKKHTTVISEHRTRAAPK